MEGLGLSWDVIKGLGSVVGLLTGVFVLIDRMTRGEPTAIVQVAGSDMSRHAELVVTNHDDRMLLFRLGNAKEKNQFFLSPDDSTISVIQLVLGNTLVIPCKPEQSIRLQLVAPDAFSGDQPADVGLICFEWKCAQPRRRALPLGLSDLFTSKWKKRKIRIRREDYLSIAADF